MASNLTKDEQKLLKMITPEFTLSYPFVFTPRENDQGKEKYSISMVYDGAVSKTEFLTAIRMAVKEKWGAKPPTKLTMPIRADAEDVAEKGYPQGSWFMNVSSDNQPGIVDGQLKPITDSKEIYPGIRARASIKFYAYDRAGSRGVTAGLNNLQKIGDGPRLDGRRPANEDFEALAPADLADAVAGLE